MAIGVQEAADVIARDDPELSMVVAYKKDAFALELISEIAEFARGPVIAILEREDADFVAEAAARGMDAHSRLGDAESIQSAIEVAMRRHAERRELVEQVQRLETALERRAMIERAKGILMERHGIDDRAAFDRLRDHARSRNRTVVDVAAAGAGGPPRRPHQRAGAGAPGGRSRRGTRCCPTCARATGRRAVPAARSSRGRAARVASGAKRAAASAGRSAREFGANAPGRD